VHSNGISVHSGIYQPVMSFHGHKFLLVVRYWWRWVSCDHMV